MKRKFRILVTLIEFFILSSLFLFSISTLFGLISKINNGNLSLALEFAGAIYLSLLPVVLLLSLIGTVITLIAYNSPAVSRSVAILDFFIILTSFLIGLLVFTLSSPGWENPLSKFLFGIPSILAFSFSLASLIFVFKKAFLGKTLS